MPSAGAYPGLINHRPSLGSDPRRGPSGSRPCHALSSSLAGSSKRLVPIKLPVGQIHQVFAAIRAQSLNARNLVPIKASDSRFFAEDAAWPGPSGDTSRVPLALQAAELEPDLHL